MPIAVATGPPAVATLERVLRSWLFWAIFAVAFAGCNSADFPFFHAQPLKWQLAANGLAQDGMWKSTPVFADVNQDGSPDLAALPRLGQGARVWLGDRAGTWREASAGLTLPMSCGGGVAFGDLNKDGRLDLVVADHCAGVFVYLGDGHGHWKATTAGLNPGSARQPVGHTDEENNRFTGAEDVAVGDVNEDGFADLVVASRRDGGITVYLGDGSGKVWKEAVSDGLPKSGFATKLLLRDIDGDGHLDIVAAYEAGPRVWRGDGMGHWQSYSDGLPTHGPGGFYRGLALGDVNEDGRLDLVVANRRDGPELYLQTEAGGWHLAPPPLPSMKGGALSVALGDLDRDGHLDMVVGGRHSLKTQYGLFVVRGDGKGGWSELQNTNLPGDGLTFIWGIALDDVNGDGLLDIAVTTGTAPVERQPEESLPRMQVWLNRYQQKSSGS